MLAYVFWHSPAGGVAPSMYEESLTAFHRALAAHAPSGFRGSAAFAFRGAPWFSAEAGYLDWYEVEDFAGLGALNDAAVAGARKDPHDKVAQLAGAGLGGLYRLVAGSADFAGVSIGTWFRKPDGMSYRSFLDQASMLIDPSSMGLWQRQMSLGPGLEFCILSTDRVKTPETFSPVTIEMLNLFTNPKIPS